MSVSDEQHHRHQRQQQQPAGVGNVTRRPNVVLIVTDQHRPDHTGFGGHPLVETPHLDRIAAAGTVFDRAYVSNPICMPNRSTIMTGRVPSVHGVRFNGISLDWGANTFVRVLREAGYRTGLVGKSHLQNMGHLGGLTESFFSTPGDSVRDPWPDGWNLQEDAARHRAELVEVWPDFYGFDHVELVVDHSDGGGGHYHQWLVAQGVDPATMLGAEHALERVDCGWDQIRKPALPEELYPTSYVRDRAVAFLDSAAATAAGADATEPFFLQVSFPDPHHPFTPPGRYYHRYDPADVTLPATFHDPLDHAMPHISQMAKFRGRQTPGLSVAPFAPNERQLREAMAKELGMIAMIDDAVGDVLAALDRSGLVDDTIVVFTSDHGDMFGDHGLLLKATLHYTGCVRVPLVISRPTDVAAGRAGARSSSLVGSLDLAQTMLDLCGLPEYHGMQGASLVPVLDDPSVVVHDRVLVEEDEMFDLYGTGHNFRMRTIITDAGRLSRYHGAEMGEVYDHGVDPGELENRWADPAGSPGRALRAELHEAMAEEFVRVADESPKPTHFA